MWARAFTQPTLLGRSQKAGLPESDWGLRWGEDHAPGLPGRCIHAQHTFVCPLSSPWAMVCLQLCQHPPVCAVYLRECAPVCIRACQGWCLCVPAR